MNKNVCGKFEVTKYRKTLSAIMKRMYYDCFRLKVTEQDISWAPRRIFFQNRYIIFAMCLP